jgi:D-inositol-3-phosphate glycosyltransferase
MTVKRVAVVCYHSSPLDEPGTGDAGGMTVYVRAVAAAMARRGVHTHIFSRATAPGQRPAELFPGARVVPLEAGPLATIDKEHAARYVDDFIAGMRTFSLAQRISFDVVHSHYWQSGLVAGELARAWNVPMVHSHHTLGRVKNNALAPGDRPEPHLRLVGEEATIAAADVLVASTDEEWSQLSCLYGAEHDRLKTIHPGVDHSLFHPGDRDAARRTLGLKDEAVVLYVGRIQPLKGLDLVIQALGRVAGTFDRDLVFLVAGGASGSGGDDELDRLSKIAADNGLQGRVRFVGPQPHLHLPKFYRAADVVAVASHSESFGLSALEAQACGTPVVATAVGGLTDVIDDGVSGFLVESRDPALFADRLRRVLHNGVATKMRDEAARRAARFSWDATAGSLLELYECLVAEEVPEACTC